MKLIAFDTSTEQLSIAVQHGDRVLAYTGAGGPQSSAALIPSALELLAQADLTPADLDAVVFGRGPGSFTGLRTACSVAQGFAFGARRDGGVPVLPVDTLLAVAEEARLQIGATRVYALLDARMGEIYSAAYAWDDRGEWSVVQDTGVSKPEALMQPWNEHLPADSWCLAGNGWAVYEDRLPTEMGRQQRVNVLPTARALLSLSAGLLAAGKAVPADQALPLYIRDKVAQTTAERAAALSG